MSDKRAIRAKNPAVPVPDKRGNLLGKDPQVVEWSSWWQRRLDDGDIEIVTQSASEEKKQK